MMVAGGGSDGGDDGVGGGGDGDVKKGRARSSDGGGVAKKGYSENKAVKKVSLLLCKCLQNFLIFYPDFVLDLSSLMWERNRMKCMSCSFFSLAQK